MRLCWYSGRVPLSELPHGEVTIADLYRSLVAIQDAMSSLATEVRLLGRDSESSGRMSADHETRLRILETTRAKLIGAATFAGVLAGALGGYVTSHLH